MSRHHRLGDANTIRLQ